MTPAARRIGALRRFAIALTVFNLLGHTVFGFEQSTAQPLVALAIAYAMELVLELVDARLNGRQPAFLGGGVKRFVDFLLPAHITALAVSMLLYANSELWPVMLATAAAVASKHAFRIRIGTGTRHFFNPSNFGIALTLLAFPRIGISPPYQFSENLTGWLSWVLPVIITVSGSFINWRFTDRIPVLAGWVVGFAAQALIRGAFGANPLSTLGPMTGLVFVLYTFYMVTDPATTPTGWRPQLAFGAAVAAAYSLLVVAHVVFGFFFALTIVCALRGALIYGSRLVQERRRRPEPAAAPARALPEAGGGG